MGLFNTLMGQFVDVIEWTDDSSDTMVYRFDRQGNEIKYGAMLTVRESQMAILINEGRLADVYEPGLYKLETNNMPIMTTLESWSYGFNSPFKAEVYFFNMRRFTNLKWGTKNPVMLRDKEFGPVRLRAFGSYSIRIKDVVLFTKEIVGTQGFFNTDDISDQLRNLIVSRFSSVLGEANFPVLDLASNYEQLSNFVSAKIAPEFLEYGLELSQFLVENISLPEEVEKVLDKRTSMGVIGDLNQYTRFQAAEALQTAAANPSGVAAAGVGMGLGVNLANELSRSTPPVNSSAAMPPPLPQQTQYFAALNGDKAGPFPLDQLKQKVQAGEINAATLIWHQPLTEWVRADSVAEVAALFAAVPPPLPPV